MVYSERWRIVVDTHSVYFGYNTTDSETVLATVSYPKFLVVIL